MNVPAVRSFSWGLAEGARLIRAEELRRYQENPDDDAVRYIDEALEELQWLTKQIQRGT